MNIRMCAFVVRYSYTIRRFECHSQISITSFILALTLQSKPPQSPTPPLLKQTTFVHLSYEFY